MGSSNIMKKAIGGSIHRIREFELEKVSLAEEFDLLQIVGEGWFGKILLVEHKATDTEMVLKALPKPYTALKDFYREFHYGLHLGAHRNIITTYDVAFETAGFYVFSQEYAPLGDLTSNVSETGIGELHTKRVARQLAAALEHLHTRDLVHRDVKLDNILVFKSDFSRVKLCDFGETRRSGSVVRRRNEWLPYAPPEVLGTPTDENYKAMTNHDVWQFGIVIFVCLTGCLPWQKAAMDDPRYCRYLSWHTAALPIKRQPKLFKLVSSKAQRLFKKFLEPKPEKRPPNLADVHRFLDDRWMSKGGMEKNVGVSTEDDGLCPSMYSFHSSPEEKNKLLFTLTQYGIETTVDRGAKKDRIREWIQSSVIEEEDEGEGDGEYLSDEDVHIRDNQTGPPGERQSRGPIGVGETRIDRSKETTDMKTRRERRLSSLSMRKQKTETWTPPIDPRIPLEQQKAKTQLLSESKNATNNPPNQKEPNQQQPAAKPVTSPPDINKQEFIQPKDNFTANVINAQKTGQNLFQNVTSRDASTQATSPTERPPIAAAAATNNVNLVSEKTIIVNESHASSPRIQIGSAKTGVNSGAIQGTGVATTNQTTAARNAISGEHSRKYRQHSVGRTGQHQVMKENDRYEAYKVIEKRSSSQSNSTGRSVSK